MTELKRTEQFKQSLAEVTRRDQVFSFLKPDVHPLIDTRHNILLYVEGVNKTFDGFKAINDLNLYIREGELRCIIGPNGAGKTTMMDIITGKTKPDTGEVWLGSNLNLLNMNEAEIANAGIGRKFQKPTVIECLTVWENLELAMSGVRSVWGSYVAKMTGEQKDKLESVLSLIHLHDHQTLLAGNLSHGQKQWLEIGMLLMQNPKLLLIDEPVAGMTHQEMDRTSELLNSLAGKHSVVVVEHDMDFVRSIASHVTVLHQGHVLAEGTMDEVQAHQQVKQVYLGE
ncbi:urea ABC transporter ATP-binding protein UrtD [Vibrio europaeus]|jgi:urea transport system ATP-binding protein|uniref:ABC transporter ATP-binding protein n=2 Tax=Vibrio oreintalis group TaxID=1891919 RepID=A0A178J868_9VIBR|nr:MULTISPECIES: urea ABC transporter ATP-binding protein UrtD [Vibrio oreintalis group]MDC5705495.1 urea ABC transporter ATP-binding protein UrtD [Vibrio europaeus]MDC5710774.1 urea ABC transporter ATP-binding protein UrtD [Vibrio europaeus]MDC5715864.1 urea ABC transporter ATP-binding protein UrtD [Vibrio europaeus]MDC5720025.1 urea ABC transporter ATP-binding protein UrtD [Vibrio europaeus]MDC5724088.1 urea ABC transporter ATP-binding protein UrtD [Vibrio europaeus]